MSEFEILHEIPPLSEKDFMYVADRHKAEFTYPIHCHELYELNFVENACGVRRVVGDSSEEIGNYDLVLITSPHLEHVWEQGSCTNDDIHEITIQFYINYEEENSIFQRKPFDTIRKMFQEAQRGLAFPMNAIMTVYPLLNKLSSVKESFYATHYLFEILYELSKCSNAKPLSSSSFAKVIPASDSRRITKVKDYISEHYYEDIRLTTLAEMVGMTSTSFSRFFHQHTGKTLNEYIIDIKLGHASRMLVDTHHNISEICYDCGFNTLTNFNRLFKKRKGCSPTEFRNNYRKTRIVF
jgi:AraC-like DNA-binding protein